MTALAFGPSFAADPAPSADQTETPLAVTDCGGDFDAWKTRLKAEARAQGLDPAAVETWVSSGRLSQKVLSADRGQGFFRKPFSQFAQSLIGDTRLPKAFAAWEANRPLFDRIERDMGVPAPVMLAVWGFETDFGAIQGTYNTRDALMTLAHDCRRPDMFRPQIFAAIHLYAQGDMPLETTGAWAGEIGMVQMLPSDIIARGIDGDGDGHITLKTSAPDALLTGANTLVQHGWRAGEPWLVEVVVPPAFDWSLSGLEHDLPMAQWAALGVAPRTGGSLADTLSASLILPEGYNGPAFLAYPNFDVLLQWNQSLTYVLTAAYFATRISGAEPFLGGNPSPPLPVEEMKALQAKLQALGHDVGAIDGVLGAGTRQAVKAEQMRLGLPADAWPTPDLLAML